MALRAQSPGFRTNGTIGADLDGEKNVEGSIAGK